MPLITCSELTQLLHLTTPPPPPEMRPQWFAHTEIPYGSMWPDDYLWYPKMLNNKYFDAWMKFQGHDIVLDYSITPRPSTNLNI